MVLGVGNVENQPEPDSFWQEKKKGGGEGRKRVPGDLRLFGRQGKNIDSWNKMRR